MTSSGARAVVAGHGSFPEGIIAAVEQITGCGNVFIPLSNAGLSGEELEQQLRSAAAASGAKVFFTDLPAGSATLAVRRMMRDRTDAVLVTAVNLAALLEFVFRSEMSPADAARHAADKGRLAMSVYGDG